MSFYESAPSTVSYEQLLRVIQQRQSVDRTYDERLYLVDLTNTLWERVRQVRTTEPGTDSSASYEP